MPDNSKHIDLEDGERIQKVLVQPLIDAVRSELKPIREQLAAHNKAIARLESRETKALVGFGALCLILTSVWNWVLGKLHLS